jgi:5-methylcytosine-specific restriction endonuclease McrA
VIRKTTYDANPERYRKVARAYYQAHRGPTLARMSAWKKQHAADLLLKRRVWRLNNLERDRATVRKSSLKERTLFPERVKLRVQRWCATHPGEHRQHANRATNKRRALKRQGPDPLTREEWTAIQVFFGHRCAYCGQGGLRLTQDHVIPLSRGGAHTADNVVPACRPCNRRKGTRTPLELMMLAVS